MHWLAIAIILFIILFIILLTITAAVKITDWLWTWKCVSGYIHVVTVYNVTQIKGFTDSVAHIQCQSKH